MLKALEVQVSEAMKTTLGSYISKLREEKGWSQSELARRCECSPTQIQRLEDDRIESPGFKLILSLSHALEVPTSSLASAFEGKQPTYSVDVYKKLQDLAIGFVRQLPRHLIAHSLILEVDDDQFWASILEEDLPEHWKSYPSDDKPSVKELLLQAIAAMPDAPVLEQDPNQYPRRVLAETREVRGQKLLSARRKKDSNLVNDSQQLEASLIEFIESLPPHIKARACRGVPDPTIGPKASPPGMEVYCVPSDKEDIDV